MAMNATCLGVYPPLPSVPETANTSNHFVHPNYNPDSGGLTQIISAAMARSTFSTNDVQSLLKKIFDGGFTSWDVSEITKTKPIPSVIIYTSIAIALFLLFSIIFFVVSCLNFNKHEVNNSSIKKRLLLLSSLLHREKADDHRKVG